MMHRIYSVVGVLDNGHTLTDTIDLDEGFFKMVICNSNKKEANKRGRGS
jgi:hypothetical protein